MQPFVSLALSKLPEGKGGCLCDLSLNSRRPDRQANGLPPCSPGRTSASANGGHTATPTGFISSSRQIWRLENVPSGDTATPAVTLDYVLRLNQAVG